MDTNYYAQTDRYIKDTSVSKTTQERIALVLEISGLYKVRRAADYGAGRGDLCLALSKNGIDTYSVDIPGKTSNHAACRYQEADLKINSVSPKAFFDLPDEHIDLVTCFDVFEHLDNPFQILHKIWAKIRDGGIFILSADLHNFNDEAHIDDHYIFEPFLIELVENIGFHHLDSLTLGRPNLRKDKFTFGSIRMDCFRKIMSGTTALKRFQRMAQKYGLP